MGNCGSGSHGQKSAKKDSRKHLCILYNGGDQLQRKNARSFRDALQAGEGGKNMVINFVDVNKERFDGLEWLSQIKHVLVVCVDQAGNDSIKGALDKNGIKNGGPERTMHAKVLSVSFGTDPPQSIMGDLLQRIQVDMQRDFCFEFKKLDEIDTNDFDSSDVMRKLRTTIISAMKDENSVELETE